MRHGSAVLLGDVTCAIGAGVWSTRPPVGSSIRLSSRSSVDLPAPDGPASAGHGKAKSWPRSA